MDTNIALCAPNKKERSERPADGPLPDLPAPLLDPYGTFSGELDSVDYRNEHRTRVTGRFSEGKHRARAMARYIEDLAANCAEGLDRQRQLYKLSNDIASCRNHLLFKDHFTEGKIRLSRMKSCKRALSCPLCALARANKHVGAYHEKILQLVREYAREGVTLRAWFVTLTVKNGIDLAKTYGHFSNSVTRLVDRYGDAQKAIRGEAKFQYALDSQMAGVIAGLFSFEVKRGKRRGLWHPHTHGLLLSTGTIDHGKLSDEWRAITKDSFIVDVQEVATDDVATVVECCKYALSFNELPLKDNYDAATMLKHKNLLRSFGRFRGLKLDPDIDIDDASILDSPYIELLYGYRGGTGTFVPAADPTTPLIPLSIFAVDASGSVVLLATTPRPAPYSPVTVPEALHPADSTPHPHPTTTNATAPPVPLFSRGNQMLIPGRYAITGSAFTIDSQTFLLRERNKVTKALPKFYLVALPDRYVSSLWQKTKEVFTIDFKQSDGSERIYGLDFREAGFVVITDDGLSRRSASTAPWHKPPLQRPVNR